MKERLPDCRILVATDNRSDGELVQRLLAAEFEAVALACDAQHAVEDFDRLRPQVLVLAFDEVEKAERHCLALYRFGRRVHEHLHRSVLLCSREELRMAYALCKRGYFDDYVLFWPMADDAWRLPMAVLAAARNVAAASGKSAPAVHPFAYAAGHVPAAPVVEEAPVPQPCVLVVEDDADLRKLLARMLARASIESRFAASAAEAIESLRECRPDLVLMDIGLPDLDGVEVMRRLKSVGACLQTPVVIMTGHSERHRVVDSMQSGAADFLVKPFSQRVLLDKLARHLRALKPAQDVLDG